MDTTDPELLVKLAEKIAEGLATPEELEFFLREFKKLTKEVSEDIAVDTLKASLNNSF
jgi:hypothetical protein